MIKISIIIPTLNEQACIQGLIVHLVKYRTDNLLEIIVTDGGSTDKTRELAESAGARIILSPEKRRSSQLNCGAMAASGNVLYFLHADTLPPASYCSDICLAISNGHSLGRYRSRYDSPSLLLKLNAFFSRFDLFACMGGDQGLFITRELFETTGGFNGRMNIMEDFEFSSRARKNSGYLILKKTMLISARKYKLNSWPKVQWANFVIVYLYNKGAQPDDLAVRYRQMLKH